MWALGEELWKRGMQAIPSSSINEARNLLDAIQPQLHILWIDCSMPRVCEFVEQIRARYQSVKIIGVLSGKWRCKECASEFAATLEDPEDRDPDNISYCANVVSSLVHASGAG